MARHVEMQDLTAVVAQDEKTIEKAESHRRHGEEAHRGDGSPVIPQECHPSLGSFGISGCAAHPPGDRSRGEIKTEHEEFSVYPRRSQVEFSATIRKIKSRTSFESLLLPAGFRVQEIKRQ